MGYGLLWLEALAAALLFAAMTLAFAAHIQRRWLSALLSVPAALLVLAVGAGGIAGSIFLRKWNIQNDWMTYTVSWFVAALAGIVIFRSRAAKVADGSRAALQWPRSRLAIAFLAALALTVTTYWNIDTAIRIKMAAIRHEATAMVMTIAPPSVPDSENAALVYEKAFREMQRLNRAETGKHKTAWPPANWVKDYEKPGYPVNDPEFAEYIKLREPAISLLRKAAAMPHCTFDRDFRGQEMASLLLPELGRMREGARLMAMDARAKAAQGHVREAFENIAVIDGMSAHIGAQPILISGLVACAMETIAAHATEGILTTAAPKAEDLAPLSKASPVSFERIIYRCWKGEEAFGLSNMADLADGVVSFDILEVTDGSDRSPGWPVLQSLWRVFLASDDIAAYRHYMGDLRQEMDQNTESRFYTKRATFKDGLAKSEELQNEFKTNPRGILTKALVPIMSRALESMTRGEAQQRLTKLAVAIAVYQAKNKKLPEKVEALVPEFIAEIPLDPFDEKPLRFVKNGAQITIYSVGPAMVDDGPNVSSTKADGTKVESKILFRVGGKGGF